MKKSLLSAACTSWVLAAVLAPAYGQESPAVQTEAAAQHVGVVSGSVINPASGTYLRNAIVRISSSAGTRTVTTDEHGQFQLGGVATGSVEILVSFTGFNSERQTIELAPGENKRLEFSLHSSLVRENTADDATNLAKVEVLGAREGDAFAIMEQRASMNITNSLSAESYGEIGDGNPAEFLKNMPGVDFDTVADDVPRNISLRGLPPSYTGVTINGVSLGGVDANNGASSSRQFSFEQSALTGVSSITVYKTTGADMDANAPAGTIDIRTRKAFEQKGRKITVELSAGTHSNLWDSANTGPAEGGYGGKKFFPSGKISYSDVFLDDRLGIVAGVSNNTSYVEHEQITAGRNYVATAASPYPYAVTSIGANMFNREYNRRAASVGIDFKATDQLLFSFMGSVSRGDIEAAQITPTFVNSRATSATPHQGDPSLDWTTQYPASTNTVTLGNPKFDYKIGNSRSFVPSFEWNTENFKLDGNLFFSSSDSYYDSGKKGQVALFSSGSNLVASGNYSASRSDWTHQNWNIQQTSGSDWSNPASFRFTSGRPTARTTSGSRAESELRGGGLNFSFFQDIGNVPVTWKTGFKVAQTDFDFEDTTAINTYTYNGPLTNAEFLAAVQSENDYSFGDSGMYIHSSNGGSLYMPSLSRIYRLMRDHPEQWTHSSLTPANWYTAKVANSRQLEETINSVYFMGTAELTEKLKAQAGVRWEQSKIITNEFDPLSAAQVTAAGYAVTPSTGRATTIEGLQYQYFTNPKIDRHGQYDHFFPSASVKYGFTDSLDLVVGYSKTIKRPEISDIAGVWSYNITDDGTVLSAPNTDLNPEFSDNYSVRLVKYFEPVGLVSLNYFRNSIKDLIITNTLTPEEFGYTGEREVDLVTTSTNSADEINVHGYEIEFNHAMDYLPGPFAGLSMRGSYMHSSPDIVLPRVATQVAQLGFSWKYDRLRLNLNSVWSNEKDRGLTASIVNADGVTIQQRQPFGEYLEVNVSGSYTFIKNSKGNKFGLDAFFSVNNLLDNNRGTIYSNEAAGVGDGGYHSQIYIHSGRKASIGLRARF